MGFVRRLNEHREKLVSRFLKKYINSPNVTRSEHIIANDLWTAL